MERTWDKLEIRSNLEKSDKWLYKGLLAIYSLQTAEEQSSGETFDDNGIGFNGVDSEILSSFAEFYNRAGFLTPKQTKLARKKMLKYSGQLTKIANGLI